MGQNHPVVPSRLGQNNQSGDTRALFQNKALTDIIEMFKLTSLGSNLITKKTIDSGKSASFPVVGTASAEYLPAGDSLDGKKINHSERIIQIDDLMVAHAYIFDLDKAMAHYDSKAHYIKQLGMSLAKRYEEDLFRTLVQAASIRTSIQMTNAGLTAFTDQKFNTVELIATADKNKGLSVYQAIVNAGAQWYSNENIGEPVVVLQPQQYSALLVNPASTGTTWADDSASQSGKVPMINGYKVYQTPYLTKGVVTAGGSIKAKYAGNYTGTLGVLFSPEAVAVLELIGISNEMSREHVVKSDLMSADMAVGFGVLNPAAAVLIAETGTPVVTFFPLV